MKKSLILSVSFIFLFSCNRPEPNYEGVLMTDYSRNGIESFKVVTGAQGPLGPGTELYQVPMFEQKADCEAIKVSAKDAGIFTIDPSYTYQATRGKSPYIILNYKHLGTGDEFLDNIEKSALNKLVTDSFREESRNYTTDSLMNNLALFEKSVESVLIKKFNDKGFTLTNRVQSSGLTKEVLMQQWIDAIKTTDNKVIITDGRTPVILN